ncbi:MAG: hypothetical protein Q9160_005140 [Pyrenula sp. 1 TL-2023]
MVDDPRLDSPTTQDDETIVEPDQGNEQTSHHPPKSSYFFMAPEHGIRVDGTLKPRSKFLGNSAASLMEGISFLRFTGRGTSKGGEK